LGLVVLINSIPARKWTTWPLPQPPDSDPGFPEGLTELSSFQAVLEGGHTGKKYRFLYDHFPKETAFKKLVEYYERLPMVMRVEHDDAECPFDVTVTLNNGERFLIDASSPVGGPPTERDVIDRLEWWRKTYEARLAKNDCYFFFASGLELSLPERTVLRDLRLIVQILRSDKSIREKANLLDRLDFLPAEGAAGVAPLLTGFEASEQLDARIEAMLRDSDVKPRTYAEIPSESAAEREDAWK
jgi:hypothetical protein